jgi:hypothetical protein
MYDSCTGVVWTLRCIKRIVFALDSEWAFFACRQAGTYSCACSKAASCLLSHYQAISLQDFTVLFDDQASLWDT